MIPALALAAALVVPPALLAGWGFLVGRFLLTGRMAPLLPWLAPALGLAFVASIGPAAGAAGLPIRFIAWPVAALAALGWTLALRAGGVRTWIRTHWPALVIAGGAFLVAAMPLLLLGRLTTVGGSIDAISYNVRSEYLQQNALLVPDVIAGKPYLGWVRAAFAFRVGDVYWLGLLSSLLGRRSYEMMTLVAVLAHATTAFGTYFLTRVGLGLRRPTAALAAALVAVNNTLFWPAIDCSLSQAVALGLIPFAVAAGGLLFRRPAVRLAIALGILLSALAAIYPIFLVLVVGALGLNAVLATVWSPIRGQLKRRLLTGGVAAFTALAANPIAWPRAFGELGFIGGMVGPKGLSAVGPGNILVFPPLAELFGLISHVAASHGNAKWGVPGPLVQALTIVAASLCGVALVRLGATRRAPVAALLVVATGLALHQRFLVNPPHGYPYGYFKLVTVLGVLLAALMAAGLGFVARQARLRTVSVALAVALLGVSSLNAAWTVHYSATTQILATADLVAAADAARSLAGQQAIEIAISAGPKENWLGYLLDDSLVVFRRPTVHHPVVPPALSEGPRFVLSESPTSPQDMAGREPDGRPARFRWSGGGFAVREFLDSLLAEWPGPGTDWPAGSRLNVRQGTPDRSLELDMGGQPWTGLVPQGRARTVQVLVSATSSARLEGPGEGIDIGPGTWALDLDLGCPTPLQVALKIGTLTLGPTRVLGDPTGVAGRCVEVFPSQLGFLRWWSRLDGTTLRMEADLVPPGRSDPHHYRLGLHVGGGLPGLTGWYGVWSIDFPADGRAHRAVIEIDLGNRKGRGKMDGADVTILQTNRDVSAGKFEATMVLWRLDPNSQLYVDRALTFEIRPDASFALDAPPHAGQQWWRSP